MLTRNAIEEKTCYREKSSDAEGLINSELRRKIASVIISKNVTFLWPAPGGVE